MTTESLIVELGADTGDLDKALTSTDKKLDDLNKTTGKSDAALGKLTDVAAATAKAFVGAGVALTTFITLSAKSNLELKNLADTAKLSTAEFQSMAFAFGQIGVDAKGTADALNDVTERLGEFAAAGSGPFQDFADVMGLTSEDAQELAKDLQYLSGDQAIQYMVNEMEDANIATAQMSFVMKSMSNDLEYASGLFADNGAELNRLQGRYKALHEELALTSAEAQDLQDVAESFDLLTEAFGLAAQKVSSTLAPVLNAFFNSVIEVTPRATQAIVDFINAFRDAANIEDATSVTNLIGEQRAEIEKIERALGGFQASTASYNYSEEERTRLIKESSVALVEERARLAELEDQLKSLQETERLGDANQYAGGEITGGDTDTEGGVRGGVATYTGAGSTEEEELLSISTERWLAYGQGIADYNASLYLAKQDQYDADLQAEADHLAKMADQYSAYGKARVAADKLTTKQTEQNERDKVGAMQDGLSAVSSINDALLEDNKAVGAGIIVADTAIGVQKALAQGGMFGWAQAAAIAASGIAQLARLKSASRGSGGTTNTVTAPTTVDTTQEQETTTADVTDSVFAQGSDASGQGITLTIEADDSAVAEAISGILGQAKVSGVIA